MWDLATIVKLNDLAAEAIEHKLPQRLALESIVDNGSHPKHMIMIEKELPSHNARV